MVIEMKVVNVHWFGHMYVKDKCMGIVKALDETTKEFKYYIGFGRGINEEADIQEIIAWGQKYTEAEFQSVYSEFLNIK